jgi:tripartite-type tricarboxylate transporter receptor subunit TctC
MMAGWTRSVSGLLFGVLALQLHPAQPQTDFPTKPVRIVVPFAAGGPTDVVMRGLGDLLSARWGQPVIIENRPGAGTVLGTNYLAKSPPDGYTLGAALSAFVTSAAARASLPYDPLKDLTAVGTVTTTQWALVVHPSFPANSVAEFVAEAKRRSVPIDYAAPGIGGLGHMAGELLQRAAGIKMQFIPYGGSAVALTDVIAGRVPVMFDVWSSARPHVLAGSLKLLGAAGAKRLPHHPQVATIAETYPGFEVTGF